MNAISQNILNGVVAIVIAGALWSLQPKIALDTHGILLPATNHTYPAVSPGQVQFYSSAPESYTTVGLIRTTIHFDNTDQATQQNDFNLGVAFAQQLAAAAGANGVLIQNAGPSEGGVNPLDGFMIYAKAIIVNENNSGPLPLRQSQ